MVALLHPEQVAEQLGVTVATLKDWRYHSTGPAFLKLNRLVRYRQEDLDFYVESLLPKSNVTQIGRARSA